jgi:hypothetical protein
MASPLLLDEVRIEVVEDVARVLLLQVHVTLAPFGVPDEQPPEQQSVEYTQTTPLGAHLGVAPGSPHAPDPPQPPSQHSLLEWQMTPSAAQRRVGRANGVEATSRYLACQAPMVEIGVVIRRASRTRALRMTMSRRMHATMAS